MKNTKLFTLLFLILSVLIIFLGVNTSKKELEKTDNEAYKAGEERCFRGRYENSSIFYR